MLLCSIFLPPYFPVPMMRTLLLILGLGPKNPKSCMSIFPNPLLHEYQIEQSRTCPEGYPIRPIEHCAIQQCLLLLYLIAYGIAEFDSMFIFG